MNDDRDAPWFRAKRYGYGAGLPIAWQGWFALGLLLFVLIAPGFCVPLFAPSYRVMAMIVSLLIALCAAAIFLALCRARTEGGFRWRWGDQD